MEEDAFGTESVAIQAATVVEDLRKEGSTAITGFLTLLEKDFDNVVPGCSDPDLGNQTAWIMPSEMKFNDAHIISIAVYSTLMFLSAIGNVTVLWTIIRLRRKGQRSRVNLFLLHLAVADLLVTFLLMPLEIAWNWTVSWAAGDVLCRVMAFFRTFGLYLSGFLLIGISLDRSFAVLKPLDMNGAIRRSRLMLVLAWSGSGICSVPQALVFHVEKHPKAPWFEQCVTFNFFPTPELELVYIAFGFIFLYGFPLVMIVGCYVCILWKISTVSKEGTTDNLRRSNTDMLSRAKTKTLKLTVTIVATFCLCWTPYNVIALWYMVDRQSAQQIDQRVQKGLFIFACTNSCFNPLVYGYFHFKKRREVKAVSVCNLHCARPRLQEQSQSCNLRVRWGISQSTGREKRVEGKTSMIPSVSHRRLSDSFQLTQVSIGARAINSSQQEQHLEIILEARSLHRSTFK